MTRSAGAEVFVDIDGVINAQPDGPDDLEHWPADTWRSRYVDFGAPMGAGTLTWNLAAVDALRVMGAMPGVQMRWCTTWGDHAVDLLAPIVGLGHDWPVAPWVVKNTPTSFSWWKAQNVNRAVAARGVRAVWIDDDIDTWRREVALQQRDHELGWLHESVLAVCPDRRRGITSDHIQHIEQFLEGA
ncbi:hypothetical protein [Demequina sp. NBRC 110055]|uniref:hypothetical protein n=1 Tax=Demequina sp. NBRC 110055 TaxID=1570344 RepID=UPI0009FC7563|nr:hypothetical protein [Demequina sp. NBRC 110055]